MRRKKGKKNKTYTIKVFWCPVCGHIFQTSRPTEQIDPNCLKCRKAKVKKIDSYKSKTSARVSAPKRKNGWIQR